MSISSTFMAETAKNELLCMIQGTVECLPCKKFEVHCTAPALLCTAVYFARAAKCTAMHQQQHPVQPANTQENLNIQPSEKIWKMEGDGSLGSPAY